MPGAALTIAEREEISRGLVDDETFTSIADRIDRHKSTVSREVGRHGSPDGYRACQAHEAARRARRRPKERELAANSRLCGEVEDRLKKKHSPEQIATSTGTICAARARAGNRLLEDFPDDESMRISHETRTCTCRPAAACVRN